MSFAQEVKDFISGYKTGASIMDKRDQRRQRDDYQDFLYEKMAADEALKRDTLKSNEAARATLNKYRYDALAQSRAINDARGARYDRRTDAMNRRYGGDAAAEAAGRAHAKSRGYTYDESKGSGDDGLDSGGVRDTSGGSTGFAPAMSRVFQFEGGYNPNDSNGAPSNMGVNAAANPDVDVRNLTKNRAAQLYKTRYWDTIGGDNLPPTLAAVAFDTSVMAGPARARQMLKMSGGDPEKFFALRGQFLNSLVERNPAKFGKYAKAWSNRTNTLYQDYLNRRGGAPAYAEGGMVEEPDTFQEGGVDAGTYFSNEAARGRSWPGSPESSPAPESTPAPAQAKLDTKTEETRRAAVKAGLDYIKNGDPKDTMPVAPARPSAIPMPAAPESKPAPAQAIPADTPVVDEADMASKTAIPEAGGITAGAPISAGAGGVTAGAPTSAGAGPDAGTAERMSSPKYALSASELGAIGKKIDPEGKLNVSMRRIAELTGTYQYFVEKGDMAGAQRTAAGILNASRLLAANYAAAALSQKDTLKAAGLLVEGYNQVPDGRSAEIQGGFIVQKDMATGKELARIPINERTIFTAAQRMQDGSGVWSAIMGSLGPAGGSKSSTSKSSGQKTSDMKDMREYNTMAKTAVENALKSIGDKSTPQRIDAVSRAAGSIGRVNNMPEDTAARTTLDLISGGNKYTFTKNSDGSLTAVRAGADGFEFTIPKDSAPIVARLMKESMRLATGRQAKANASAERWDALHGSYKEIIRSIGKSISKAASSARDRAKERGNQNITSGSLYRQQKRARDAWKDEPGSDMPDPQGEDPFNAGNNPEYAPLPPSEQQRIIEQMRKRVSGR